MTHVKHLTIVSVSKTADPLFYKLTFFDGTFKNAQICPEFDKCLFPFPSEITPIRSSTCICIDHPTYKTDHIRHKVTITYVLTFPSAMFSNSKNDPVVINFYSDSYWAW